ncbi:MAG TPA: hypothetical protein PLC97_10635 [Myxococcota bacterium]|jgi:hypothetical protein|nr:hypothetical protein [Myxococcota bacterium]HQC45659.1 hypothetical protein [Myxococcota bacterium]HQL57879.1 hypothetical protein [Myxococcota bacterium]
MRKTTSGGASEGSATLSITVNEAPGCGGRPSDCRPNESLKCSIDTDDPSDCSVVFEMFYETTPGDNPRAKCEHLCATGVFKDDDPVSGLYDGLYHDNTPCHAAFDGLDCDSCCALSDKPVGENPCNR